MTFLKICNREIIENVNDGLNLRVITDNGVLTNPDININVTDLNRENNNSLLNKHFHNNGYGGITFKINIYIKPDDEYNGEKVIAVLNNWIKNMTPLYIRTEAIDVPNNDKYIITNNKDRQQKYKDATIWTLEFTTYNPLKSFVYKNNNMTIAQAKKNAVAKAKASNTKNNQLKNCKVSQMKLNKKNTCCFYLNGKLLKLGHISSKTWKTLTKQKKTNIYTKTTTTAVKKFQKAYNKKYKPKTKLKTNGKMDSATLKALIKV